MPAPRKPTAVLAAGGAFDAHPSRARPREPNTGRGIGPAPAYLSEAERSIWDEIVGHCAAGVFQSSDRLMLECLCVLVAEFRANRALFGGRKYQQLLSLLARCGMTPSDRSRVAISGEQNEKPRAGLASFRR